MILNFRPPRCSPYRGSTVPFASCLNLTNPQFVASTHPKSAPPPRVEPRSNTRPNSNGYHPQSHGYRLPPARSPPHAGPAFGSVPRHHTDKPTSNPPPMRGTHSRGFAPPYSPRGYFNFRGRGSAPVTIDRGRGRGILRGRGRDI